MIATITFRLKKLCGSSDTTRPSITTWVRFWRYFITSCQLSLLTLFSNATTNNQSCSKFTEKSINSQKFCPFLPTTSGTLRTKTWKDYTKRKLMNFHPTSLWFNFPSNLSSFSMSENDKKLFKCNTDDIDWCEFFRKFELEWRLMDWNLI